MNKFELARILNNNEYGEEISEELVTTAEECGLVVVFGASDDLMEFRGAIDDESGSPATVLVDERGLLPDRDSIDDDDELEEWFKRKKHAKKIEGLWNQEPPYAWTFKTEIPHTTFDILEDGRKWCRGIVFNLKDV